MPSVKEHSAAYDQHVLITGGGTGIGRGIAEAFARLGARVSLLGRREYVIRDAAAALGSGTFAYSCDIRDEDSRRSGVSACESAHGPVDHLVNNAGVHLKADIDQMDLSDFSHVIETHVTAAVGLAALVVPGMKDRRHGSLLFIGSMTTVIGIPKVVAYSAAKAAVAGVVRSLAVELGPFGIRANAILPGWIDTPMLHKALDGDEERERRILQRTPLQRFGKPRDIGEAAVFLAGNDAGFINGVLLPVDGGASIGF